MGMKVEFIESPTLKNNALLGTHWIHVDGDVYRVIKNFSDGVRLENCLMNVKDGGIWSSGSLFGNQAEDFTPWYGSYTVEVTP